MGGRRELGESEREWAIVVRAVRESAGRDRDESGRGCETAREVAGRGQEWVRRLFRRSRDEDLSWTAECHCHLSHRDSTCPYCIENRTVRTT